MTKLPVLVFATNNLHKLREVYAILNGLAIVRSLADFNLQTEIPEEGDTLEANARQKAWFIYNHLQKDCFADDTGLEVYALGEGLEFTAHAMQEKDALLPTISENFFPR